MDKKKFVLTEEWKQPAFTAPEGYFDTLQERVSEHIAAISAPQPSWRAALRPQLGFAAGFVAMALIGYGGVFMLNSLKGSSAGAASAADEFYSMTADYLDIDENTVLHVLSEKQAAPSVDTEAIISYLAESNISLADIAALE